MKLVRATASWPWLAIVIASTSTVLGVILTAMNASGGKTSHPFNIVVGSLLTIFGPVWISYIVSREIGKKEARDEMRAQLTLISVNLGQVAGSFSHALSDGRDEVTDFQTTMLLSNQALNGLKIQIDHIQKLIGKPFEGADIDETLDEIDAMRDKLHDARQQNDPVGIEEASKCIAALARSLAKQPREKAPISVRCPECKSNVRAMIGSGAGETSVAQCSVCGAGFNVHRIGTGEIISRTLSPSMARKMQSKVRGAVAGETASTSSRSVARSDSETPSVSSPAVGLGDEHASKNPSSSTTQHKMQCPGCGAEVKYRVKPAEMTDKIVLCLNCDTASTVSPDQTILLSTKYLREYVAIRRKAKRHFIVGCPICGKTKPCPVSFEGTMFGFCEDDKLVLGVSPLAIKNFAELKQYEVISED